MPTYDWTDEFRREFESLSPLRQALFLAAVAKFVDDLRRGPIRKSLRVKRFRGRPGLWEMTWAPDGRALFEYGEPIRPGDRHIVWRRIGTHNIFEQP
ncbi:MAG: hypothetical protein AB7R89_00605 [Dehalococcoidia bacterium]